MLTKTSFINISKTTRPIILFGSGNIAFKTISNLPSGRVDFIVDNSKNLQGTSFEGFNVRNPSSISKKYLVIICSTAITEISKQLEEMGLEIGVDFVLSPVLNDLLAINELEQLQKEIFFTSGSPPNGELGGGLYKCVVSGENLSVDKIYSGPCYGLIKKDKELLFVDTDNGIFSFDGDSIQKKTSLGDSTRAHGISYNSSNGKYYVNLSYSDAVLELDSNFNISKEFNISDKIKHTNMSMHHCNDNCAIDNSLYVTMFSSTGNWKKDCFDGCIAEFDISTGKRLNDIYTNLYMPHNVNFFNGSLHVLDSLPGHLRYGNLSVQGSFPGFTRGLDFNEGMYFIGQSKNRNYSRVFGVNNNISIDCGIVVFDPIMKTSRFLQLSPKIGEIHSVLVYD